MKRARIVWSDEAIVDVADAWAYIAAENEPAANCVVDRIEERVMTLARFPLIGRPGREPGTRELVIARTPYIVIYAVSDRSAKIVRVVHSSRQWPERRP